MDFTTQSYGFLLEKQCSPSVKCINIISFGYGYIICVTEEKF